MPFSPPYTLDIIKKNKLKVIHLKRNPIDTSISNFLANLTGTFHISANAEHPEIEKVRIDADYFMLDVEKRAKTHRFISNYFSEYEHYLPLNFESLFDVETCSVFEQDVCDNISSFLEVPNIFNRQSQLKKINESISDTVLNYDEISSLIDKLSTMIPSTDTQWSVWLDENKHDIKRKLNKLLLMY